VNSALVREIVYPAYRALKRDRVLEYLADMQRLQTCSADEIRALQWAKMRRLLEHAFLHVPYYRKVFTDLGATPEDFTAPESLTRFPLLHKADIRSNLQSLIAETAEGKHLKSEETGGSTGQNLFFYVDRLSGHMRLANNVRMNQWMGVRIGDQIACIWGVRFRETKTTRALQSLKNWLANTMYISAYRMDRAAIETYLRTLTRCRPALLIGYPSTLYHFSQEALALRARGVRPHAVMASGETLYNWQRKVIEEGFGAPVYDHYGCCEFGGVARECRLHDGLHIASDRILLETVRSTASGQDQGAPDMVMTDLDNYGMPFIRYAIEDMGTVTWEPCSCGLTLPRIKNLMGRVYDVVRAPNGNWLGGTFWGHVLKQGVEKFQVTQEALDQVSIAIVPTAEFGDQVKAYVLEKVRAACGPDMKVTFDLRKSIEATRSGKHRYVISRIVPAPSDPAGPSPGDCAPGGPGCSKPYQS
jgi:phenylacetate-CoA ligase